MTKHWYAVHTYSGYEQKAQEALQERIKIQNASAYFDDILIPSEDVVEVKKGVKKTSKKQFFPGYMLVKMELNEKTYHVVKGTPKVTGIVGGFKNPSVVPDEEVERITRQIKDGTLKPTPKVQFERGENVRVTGGPFSSFAGIVDEVEQEKGKVRVLVSIFGRSTPIELDFTQIEKV